MVSLGPGWGEHSSASQLRPQLLRPGTSPSGTPPCKPRLASQVGTREELRAPERGILRAVGVDWESQPKPKESTPMQDILEENSFHDLQMWPGLDLRMQIRPVMGESGILSTPEDRPALRESLWPSGYTGLKAAVQIQRVAMPEPALGISDPWAAKGSGLSAQDSVWLQEESVEEEAVVSGVLSTYVQM